MAVLAVVPLTRAIQYDGTNSAEIDATITDLTIISEFGGTLTIESNGGQHPVPTDGYLIFNQYGVVIEGVSESYFADFYAVVPDPDTITALEEGLEDLPDSIEAVGAATFGAILPSGSANVNVQLIPAMPNSSYNASAQVFGGTNIGALNITNIAVVDSDTVTVTVENTGLVSLGASVMVAATAN